jgi:hypothetical protein
MPTCFWGQKEAECLGVIVSNRTLRTTRDIILAVRDRLLSETQKQIKSFVSFCSYYGKFIHHFSVCAALLTNMCRKNLPSNVVHNEATKSAYKTLKSRMISAPVLLIREA